MPRVGETLFRFDDILAYFGAVDSTNGPDARVVQVSLNLHDISLTVAIPEKYVLARRIPGKFVDRFRNFAEWMNEAEQRRAPPPRREP